MKKIVMMLLLMLSLQGIDDDIVEYSDPGKDAVEFMNVLIEK